MEQDFINEPIEVFGAGINLSGLVTAPTGFSWRGQDYKVVEILEMQKGYGRDRSHNSPERYLDRQWFSCRLDSGQVTTFYFDRRARGKQPRWYIYNLKNLA